MPVYTEHLCRDVCSTRPSGQGCLYCRLALCSPRLSLHSLDTCRQAWYSTRFSGTGVSALQTSLCAPLDCLFVLSGSLQTSLVLNQVLWMRGVGAVDQAWCSPIALCRPNQVLVIRGVCAADQPWCSPCTLCEYQSSAHQVVLDQGCLCCRPALVLPLACLLALKLSNCLVLNQVLWIRGVCAADQPWCSPLACFFALSTSALANGKIND